MPNDITNEIRRQTLIHAPCSKVWRALTTPQDFGAWFGVNLTGADEFKPNTRMRGQIAIKGFEHVVWDVTIEQVEPEHLFSWRWHPFAIEKGVDYSHEPTTLVVFTLEETPEGTLLTVVESGFDGIPAHRRLDAFRANSNGWEYQMKNITRHVTGAA